MFGISRLLHASNSQILLFSHISCGLPDLHLLYNGSFILVQRISAFAREGRQAVCRAGEYMPWRWDQESRRDDTRLISVLSLKPFFSNISSGISRIFFSNTESSVSAKFHFSSDGSQKSISSSASTILGGDCREASQRRAVPGGWIYAMEMRPGKQEGWYPTDFRFIIAIPHGGKK